MPQLLSKTIWLDAPESLRFADEPVAAPDAGEMLCRTEVSAISPGTEIAAWKGMPPLRPGPIYPRLQGYCNVATVLELGPGCAGLEVGDRVLTHQSHRSHFTASSDTVLYRLPAEADARHIATAYLYHLGYHAVIDGGVRAGHRVLVQGLGVLGLTSAAMAKQAGASVFAVSDQSEPSRVAMAAGADGVLTRNALDTALEIDGDSARFDVVISTVNGWGDWQRALAATARRGTIACLGFPGRGEEAPAHNPLPSEHFYDRQLTVKAVGMAPLANEARGHLRFNLADNMAYICKLIEKGALDAELLISGSFPAADAETAYRKLASRDGSPLTYLLEWSA